MKKLIVLLFATVACGIIVFDSCKKKEETPTPTPTDTVKTVYSQTTVSNTAVAMSIYTDVVTDVLASSDSASAHNKTTCPTVNLTPLAGYPKTLTINFGSSGCTYNNKTVKGTITATLSGAIRTSGTVVSIAFNNFQVDTIVVSGTLVLAVTNVVLTPSAQITFRDSVKNGILTFPSGTISLSCNMDLLWSLNTLNIYTDDQFTISNCSATGTNKEGKSFTLTVLENLIIKASCQEMVDGKLQLTTTSIPYPATIDFGDGTCDGTATITTKIKKEVGNQTFEYDYTYTITLP